MPRKYLVYVVLAAFSAETVGCASPKPLVRGQSPENWAVIGRLRRQVRTNMEPVWEVTRKGLAVGGTLAILVSSWFLQSAIDDIGNPSVGGSDNHHASKTPTASSRSQSSRQDQDHDRRRTDEPESDRKD